MRLLRKCTLRQVQTCRFLMLVAKIEAGDASVSLDLLVRSLIAQGATRQDW